MKASHTIVLLALAIAASAGAQSADRVADGRVRRPGPKGPVPVSGTWVVLHRVGSDHAAPLDSVRSGGDGGFRFGYKTSGAPDAIYFVSTTFRGIAYFSSPLRERVSRGGDADLLVYDTTTATSTLSAQGRHVVVSAPRNGKREVAEIFEIQNDGQRTVVPRDSANPIWATIFPQEAESLTVAPGDLSAGAVAFRGGRGEVFAPISPGMRQLVVTYRLPVRAFPLSLPVERHVSVLEVLLEEPRAVVSGGDLSETAAADIDGRTFRRFVSRDVGPPAVLRIKAPVPSTGNSGTILIVSLIVAIAMSVAVALWYSRRRPVRAVASAPIVSATDVLVAELASMDARFEKASASSAEDRARHEHQRAELKARIAQTLARETTPA